MQATNKEAIIEGACFAGDELVRLRAEQERAWEELIISLRVSFPDRKGFVLLVERYEHASKGVVMALTTFRAAIRKVGILGYSAEYLTIGDDVCERLASRPPAEVIGVDQAPGFAFAGGPAA